MTLADVRHDLQASRMNMAAIECAAVAMAEHRGIPYTTAREIVIRNATRVFFEMARQIQEQRASGAHQDVEPGK